MKKAKFSFLFFFLGLDLSLIYNSDIFEKSNPPWVFKIPTFKLGISVCFFCDASPKTSYKRHGTWEGGGIKRGGGKSTPIPSRRGLICSSQSSFEYSYGSSISSFSSSSSLVLVLCFILEIIVILYRMDVQLLLRDVKLMWVTIRI